MPQRSLVAVDSSRGFLSTSTHPAGYSALGAGTKLADQHSLTPMDAPQLRRSPKAAHRALQRRRWSGPPRPYNPRNEHGLSDGSAA